MTAAQRKVHLAHHAFYRWEEEFERALGMFMKPGASEKTVVAKAAALADAIMAVRAARRPQGFDE